MNTRTLHFIANCTNWIALIYWQHYVFLLKQAHDLGKVFEIYSEGSKQKKMSNIYACEFLPSPLLSGDGSRVQCLCWEGVARWINLCNRMFTRPLGKGTGSCLNEDTRKGWYIYWSSDRWEQNTLSRVCQIFLKVSSQCQWHILGRGTVLEGGWCKPRCGNDFFLLLFHATCLQTAWLELEMWKKELDELVRKILFPIEQLNIACWTKNSLCCTAFLLPLFCSTPQQRHVL